MKFKDYLEQHVVISYQRLEETSTMAVMGEYGIATGKIIAEVGPEITVTVNCNICDKVVADYNRIASKEMTKATRTHWKEKHRDNPNS